MPISIACHECGKKYSVADRFAGRTMSCKNCGSEIDVSDSDDDVSSAPRSSSGKSRSKKKRRRGNARDMTSLIYVVVGALLIGGGFWGVKALIGRGGNANDGFSPGGVGVDTSSNASPSVQAYKLRSPVLGSMLP